MNTKQFFSDVNESADFLRKQGITTPKVLVVLTSGIRGFDSHLKERRSLRDIPHFPKSRVAGHSGEVVFGKLRGAPVCFMLGRYHYYEEGLPHKVIFPYLVFGRLGAKVMITTHAAGGINKSLNVGDIMLIEDHINLTGINPLVGLAKGFVEMTNAHSSSLHELAFKVARRQKLKLKKGVYAGVTGPSYETAAEIRAFRQLGADAVGMSSAVFEAIAAAFTKMKFIGFSIITNKAAGTKKGEINHSEVLKNASKVETKLIRYIEELISVVKV